MVPRLDEGSKAVKVLRLKLDSGEIGPDDDARTIQALDPLFLEYKPETFRTRLNRLKKEYFDDDDEPPLKRQCTLSGTPKMVREEPDYKEDHTSDKVETVTKRLLATPSPVFAPLHLESFWVEPGTTNRMVTVAIVLPSGGDPNGVSVRFKEGGRELELTVQWPTPLVDLNTLHRKWLDSCKGDKMEVYHPKLLGFEACLKKFHRPTSDTVESTALSPLSFPVQTHIVNQYPLGLLDSTCRMVYVDLKAYEEDYALARIEDLFEIC